MTSKPTGPGRVYRRLLIIKPSSLGDIVHALPVLAALRSAYPRAHIAWMVSASFVPLLEAHPLIDEAIPFDRRRFGRMLRHPGILVDFLRFVHYLRSRRFDLVLDLQGLFRSGFLAFASGAGQRLGFADSRELAGLFYTRRIRCGGEIEHAVDKNLALAAALGLDVSEPAFPLGLTAPERNAARARLAEAAGRGLESFLAVLPGARWESKRWPAERFADLVDRLHDEGQPPCVLLGAAEDGGYADRIVSAARSPVINLVGRTSLRELVALLDLASLVVCHDSGPMHLAAALQRPLVALFGPTNPRRTGPYGAVGEAAGRLAGYRSVVRVVSRSLPCAPCYRRVCPLGHHACLGDLEVEQVMKAIREIRGIAVPACLEHDSRT